MDDKPLSLGNAVVSPMSNIMSKRTQRNVSRRQTGNTQDAGVHKFMKDKYYGDSLTKNSSFYQNQLPNLKTATNASNQFSSMPPSGAQLPDPSAMNQSPSSQTGLQPIGQLLQNCTSSPEGNMIQIDAKERPRTQQNGKSRRRKK